MRKGISRRRVLGGGVAAGFAAGRPAASPARTGGNVYTRLGVKPFINLTATYTINGGAPMHPEVRQAMEEAANWAVNLDELMEKAGERIAQLLHAEAALVSCGCAAALVLGTAACMAGADPERMKQLPDTRDLRNEVIIPRQSRNDYDHAFRVPGARLVEIDTREEFLAALGHRTAAVAVLGTGEPKGKLRLEEMAELAHQRGVPVMVDAAAELPLPPNPYLSRGADLVAYSGGKILRGPQSAGLLLGRKDLVRAAWSNSSPHHALGRALKVSKEEVIGMVAAIEQLSRSRIEQDYRTWESWYAIIAAELAQVQGVRTRLVPPDGPSPFPVLEVSWDPERIRLTGDSVHRQLLEGEPRIMSHAQGEGSSFVIRAVAMRPEHPPLVARRLAEVFRTAPGGPVSEARTPSYADISGAWEADLRFVRGQVRHMLLLERHGARVTGTQVGVSARGPLTGSLNGDRLKLRGSLPVEGMRLIYGFTGSIEGDRMGGELDLGEFGRGSWSARRVRS